MNQSKILNMILIDGDPRGRIKCKLANWIGIAYKIPRDKVEICKDRGELKQSGIYFLFGENEVYIGQSGSRKNGEGILNRLLEHKRNPDKNYWNEAVIFTTSDNSLGSTEISFLENKFCNLAINAKHYEVKNNNDPSPSNITEEKEIEMNGFAENVKLVMLMLGYKIFESPIKKIVKFPANDSELFYLERTLKGTDIRVKATCKKTESGFIVLAGSKISPSLQSDLSVAVKKARTTAKIDDENILQEDTIPFAKPSPAASFVTGKTANGYEYWKTADGLTLNDFLNRNSAKK